MLILKFENMLSGLTEYEELAALIDLVPRIVEE